jgi:hypothetical protein
LNLIDFAIYKSFKNKKGFTIFSKAFLPTPSYRTNWLGLSPAHVAAHHGP